LIIDACRDNPFPRKDTRTVGGARGLTRADPPQGTFVVYSAGAGQTALDRLSDADPDPNSVFTHALLPRLKKPGKSLNEMVQEVRSEVRRTAQTIRYDQFPAIYDQFEGDFFFLPAATTQPQAEAANPAATAPAPVVPDPCAIARSVWAALQDSSDKAALLAFTRAYDTTCPDLAGQALERLSGLPQPSVMNEPAASEEIAACRQEADQELVNFEQLRQSAAAAIATCSAALTAHPEDVPTLARLARALDAYARFAGARPLYERAAASGISMAMNNLGSMYEFGRGVAQSDSEALRWYRAAAEAGDASGMNNLGLMYGNGRGVAQNDNEAVRWYRAAAEAGDGLGMSNLGVMYDNGRGVAQSDNEAVRWYRAAAEAGNGSGMNNLGVMYENGRGVARDPVRAAELFLAASRVGGTWFGENAAKRNPKTLREVQRLLQEAGHYSGALDGAWGPRSRASLDAYIAQN